MRHNRRAVMAEQYKLYIRKNIFNGRYFVRNMQLVIGFIITLAVLFGAVLLIKDKNNTEVSGDNNKISAREALFGSSDVAENELSDNKQADDASIDSEVPDIEAASEAEVVADTSADAVASTSAEVETTDAVAALSSMAVVSSEAVLDDLDDNSVVEATDDGVITAMASADADKASEDTEANETPKGEFDDRCIANVDESLNVRKEPSPEAECVGIMERGSIARVVDTEGDWTKIKSGDVEGYVLSDFILTGKVAENYSKDFVTLQGTALEDGINIREDRTTEANILKVLEQDDKITVVEIPDKSDNADASDEDEKVDKTDASDDITWLTVMLDDGQIGYVSDKYVDVDKLYTLAISTEELQRREEERLAAERAAAEAAYLAQQQSSSSTSSSSSNNSTSYQGAKTTPITAANSGESLGTFYITAYCGCSKCSGGHNKTASGTTPTEGRTIAADTSILPFGSQVVIDGVVYTVEDRGSGVCGNHIDIFFATHEDALAYGSKSVTVYKY